VRAALGRTALALVWNLFNWENQILPSVEQVRTVIVSFKCVKRRKKE
jgi:hypothetical protein